MITLNSQQKTPVQSPPREIPILQVLQNTETGEISVNMGKHKFTPQLAGSLLYTVLDRYLFNIPDFGKASFLTQTVELFNSYLRDQREQQARQSKTASKINNTMKMWPRVGSKITYKGANKAFWFTSIIENAEKNLEVGKEYTVAKLHLASSWCGVELVETGDTEYSLGFFNYPKERTTQEVREQEYNDARRTTD